MNLKAVLFLLMVEKGTLFMENSDDNKEAGIERRKHQRSDMPATVNCTLLKKDIKGKNSFQGFIQDISLGGASLEVRDDFLTIDNASLKYTEIRLGLELNTSDGIQKINFTGIIRWHRRVKKQSMNLLYLGVQFFALDERDQAILEKYLALGTGDKSLIWNLWDNLSIQP